MAAGNLDMAAGNLDYQGPFGNMLLHGAVLLGDAAEVERLLRAGADPWIANREGHTPGQVAIFLGDRFLYELLERRGESRIERLLDQALEQTFPASDPVAVTPESRTRR